MISTNEAMMIPKLGTYIINKSLGMFYNSILLIFILGFLSLLLHKYPNYFTT